MHGGICQRRIRLPCHINRQRNHYETHHLGEFVHHFACFFKQKHTDGNHAADHGTGFRRQSGQQVQPQACAADVTDIECQTAHHNQHSQEIACSGQDLIGNILRPFFGSGDNPPNIELRPDVEQNREQNHKAETCPQCLGESGGLGQKARADGGSRHQECSAD